MTKWKVVLEGVEEGKEDDLVLNFQDTQDVMERIVVERYTLQDISKHIKKKDHYYALPNVKEVVSDTAEQIPHGKTAVILMTLKKSNEKLGFLLTLADEFNFEVRGLRPDGFVEQVSQNNASVTELLKKLSADPDAFEDVNIIFPEDRY